MSCLGRMERRSFLQNRINKTLQNPVNAPGTLVHEPEFLKTLQMDIYKRLWNTTYRMDCDNTWIYTDRACPSQSLNRLHFVARAVTTFGTKWNCRSPSLGSTSQFVNLRYSQRRPLLKRLPDIWIYPHTRNLWWIRYHCYKRKINSIALEITLSLGGILHPT